MRGVHDVVKLPTTGQVFVREGPGGRSSKGGHTFTVFGNTGFVGRYVVNNLGRRGNQVVLPYRGTDDDRRHLRVMGDLGQIVQPRFDMRNEEQVVSSMRHSDTVINLIGRDYETKNFTFEQVNVDVPRQLAKLSKQLGVGRFIHVSALGANVDSPSKWLKTKALGEIAVREEFPEATIIRPATLYGTEDKFWNRIGWYVKYNPLGLPIVNDGKTIVGDVAAVIAKSVDHTESIGKIVELYGPRAYYYGNIINFFLDVTKRTPTVWSCPKSLAKLLAWGMDKGMAIPIITPDEVERSFIDQVPGDKNALTFENFNITPVTVEDTILRFIRAYRPAEFQRAPYEVDVKKYQIKA
ncbi:39kDa subunit of ndufa9, NADH:ubiquinone oxidoreductase [Chytridiales sp. JEL 0842]|nr:39kDa subunit of ndufa9, NADH:ubiquinone oxidoreductase [Chytridiales sp. JEL 0842]